MTYAQQNFEIDRTATNVLRIPVVKEGFPRPLTGLSCEWDMATAEGAASILAKTTAAGIVIPASESATAQGGDRTSIDLAAGANAEDGFYTGRHIRLTAGAGAGQWRQIEDYDGALKRAYVSQWAYNAAPDATTGYQIVDSVADVTIDDADTAALDAGDYAHRLRVIDGAGEPATVTKGTVTIASGIA